MKKVESDFELLEQFVDQGTEVAIDVGCGSGDIVRWLSAKGIKTFGIDSEKLIKLALAEPPDANAKYIIGDDLELQNFENNYADFICFIASFHHVPALQMLPTVNECKRIIKLGGKILLIEPLPERNSYHEIIRLVEDEKKKLEAAYSVLYEHIQHEELFYLERSFDDYTRLLEKYVSSEKERAEYLTKARLITEALCADENKSLQEYKYKSWARLIILNNR